LVSDHFGIFNNSAGADRVIQPILDEILKEEGGMALESGPTKSKKNANNWIGPVLGFVIVVLLAIAAHWVKTEVYSLTLFGIVPGKVLEYPVWAVMIGIIANILLKATHIYNWVRRGFRTELFLKIGLVLLGAGISFNDLGKAGIGGILQALIMVTSVFFFCWWLSGKFRLSQTLRAVMSTAIAVCGVSAAIAAAGSVLAKKEETTYITTLVVLIALPLMVLSPIAASRLGLSESIAGAWFGGNVDTTAAVVGAGTIYGDTAQQVATIVKTVQNTLIGVVAFLLAVTFASSTKGVKTRPSPVLIWQRFPKFVLGFILASMLFTFGIIPAASKTDPTAGNAIVAMKDWFFCLAFVSMGLDLSVGEVNKMGWSPLVVYLIVTVFNTILALIVAWFIFGWLFPL
jgi:uncharacterized membrane protein YadS